MDSFGCLILRSENNYGSRFCESYRGLQVIEQFCSAVVVGRVKELCQFVAH